MILVIGLGNPGIKYAANRHNVGFMVIDTMVARFGGSIYNKFNSEIIKLSLSAREVLMAKPLTYMNRSGGAVGSITGYYGSEISEMLVIHDDLDIEFGQIRFKAGGGTAGHRGLNSIASVTKTKDFHRLRVGIGRPEGSKDPSVYVLEDFSRKQAEELPFILETASRAVEDYICHGLDNVMNKYN
ncbi:MAG: aminoacyl-tRNA hydrolase [Actinomycetota bacterium]